MKKKKENKPKEKMVRPKSPIDYFFDLGRNLTPEKQLDFTYYLLWIIFLAFFFMFVTNIYRVINGDWYSLIWAAVGFAISCLQFFSLRSMWDMRKARKDNPIKVLREEKLESVDDMLKGFESENMKGGKDV